MATIKNTYNSPNNFEDMSNEISNLSPTDTIAMSAFGSMDIDAKTYEWNTDTLDEVGFDNAQVEGADAPAANMTPTVRLTNFTQIASKTVVVSASQREVDSAGYADELDYQMVKKGKELKVQMEQIILKNGAKVAGDGVSVAGKLAGLETFISTNVDAGVGAVEATGDGTDARTTGTLRDFTEVQLKSAILKSFNEGGNPDLIMVGGTNKQAASEFTGNATLTRNTDSTTAKLATAINIYGSDFGDLKIVANRRQNLNSALILDTELFKVGKLRDFRSFDLAKTGDSDKKQILCEFTLVSKNEIGSAAVYDLNA